MAHEQLIHLKPKGDSRSDGVRAKLKGSSSEKRKKAQQLSAIARMSKATLEKKALMLVTNEELSAFEIERMILEMLKHPMKEELRAKLLDTAIKAHTAFHGAKSKNLNMNVDVTSFWDKIKERAKVYEI